jgi:zinc transport system substrate-binding protein
MNKRLAFVTLPAAACTRILGLVALAVSVFGASQAEAASPPRVAVTVKPIHSLVALVMAGVAEPDILISGSDSPHTHSVRPSEARILQNADIVFWIGPTLEASYAKPLAAIPRGKVISLVTAPGLLVLPLRAPDEDGDDRAGVVDEARGIFDPHLWLDVNNARILTRAIAADLEQADPDRAQVYAANAAEADRKLAALDGDVMQQLSTIRDVPFVAFHDAYQYAERRYGLRDAGVVTLSPERVPGARHIEELRTIIKDQDIGCVFTEPGFAPALARTLTEGTRAKIATLDPEGADIPPGAGFYFELMHRFVADLRGCLVPVSK